MASSSKKVNSQYHHFIPRFILKNFSHPFQSKEKPKKGRKRRSNRNPNIGDEMVNTINLAEELPEIVEVPTARVLGMTDMYRDFADVANPHHLEKKLSVLESRAGMVISMIRKAFERGEQEVWITRPDRDTLRKFLFIMKYRGSGAHKRYSYQHAEEYSENDKHILLKYMQKRGFRKPVDVWFDNMNAMLDVEMDTDNAWMSWLLEHAFPDDAKWFIAHAQMMYLSLCTPSVPDDEFILTENAYSVHEGPISCRFDFATNVRIEGAYTEFHVFAPISPKLMIVLRSLLLPLPEEDANEEAKQWRKSMYDLNAIQHDNPQNFRSILEDLPIRRATNSYSRLIGGETEPLSTKERPLSSQDKFCFRFFALFTKHSDMINCIFLENSYRDSTIVFKSQLATRRTLERYLTMPSEIRSRPCFKVVEDTRKDPRYLFLKKLEVVIRKMGGDATAIYFNIRLGEFGDFREKMISSLPENPTETMKLYTKLGGRAASLFTDMDQAHRMLNFRIKVDVWSQGSSQAIREDIRVKLGQLFCRLLPSRVWLYLKQVRLMLAKGTKTERATSSRMGVIDHLLNGSEDTIAKAAHMIRFSRLSHLMYFATIKDIHKRELFGPAGSVCDCGIKVVEAKGKKHRDMVCAAKPYEIDQISLGTIQEKIEMTVRTRVRKEFRELLREEMADSEVQKLEAVLFDIIYPCPPVSRA